LLVITVLLSACGERITVSDVDALGLRHKVKSMDESFYIAYNSFDTIVLKKELYRSKYEFHYDCRYKSVEKHLYYNTLRHDTVFGDSIAGNTFPQAFKEPEYYFVNYKYVSDSFATLEIFDKKGDLKNHIIRKYANNRLLAEEKYSDSGRLIAKSGFWYDSKNKLLNKTVFYENGYTETNCTYSAGKKIEAVEEFNHRYKFDINGRVVSKRTYRGVAFVSETCFRYNDFGDVIMTRETDGDGVVRKTLYDYTYDSGNNWILCVEYGYTGNIFVRKRKITYYS
jgi:hypothetical protein